MKALFIGILTCLCVLAAEARPGQGQERPGHGGGWRPRPPVNGGEWRPRPPMHNPGVSNISCSSFRGETQYCQLPYGTTQVYLEREFSPYGVCQQYRTWGFEYDRLWVTAGCSANFTVYTNNGGYYPPQPPHRPPPPPYYPPAPPHRPPVPPPYYPPAPPQPPAYGNATCTTYSRGLNFTWTSYSAADAQRQVLSNCTAQGGFRNECIQNLRCY